MAGRADYTMNTILVQEDVTKNIGAVSLLGSAVVQDIIANSVEIRDTNAHYYPGDLGFSLSKLTVSIYKSKGVHIRNSHDQAVNITIIGSVSNSDIFGYFNIVASESLASGALKWYGENEFPKFSEPYDYMSVLVQASVLPTSGIVTIKHNGRGI